MFNPEAAKRVKELADELDEVPATRNQVGMGVFRGEDTWWTRIARIIADELREVAASIAGPTEAEKEELARSLSEDADRQAEINKEWTNGLADPPQHVWVPIAACGKLKDGWYRILYLNDYGTARTNKDLRYHEVEAILENGVWQKRKGGFPIITHVLSPALGPIPDKPAMLPPRPTCIPNGALADVITDGLDREVYIWFEANHKGEPAVLQYDPLEPDEPFVWRPGVSDTGPFRGPCNSDTSIKCRALYTLGTSGHA